MKTYYVGRYSQPYPDCSKGIAAETDVDALPATMLEVVRIEANNKTEAKKQFVAGLITNILR